MWSTIMEQKMGEQAAMGMIKGTRTTAMIQAAEIAYDHRQEDYTDGFVQDWSVSIANALRIPQSCMKWLI